MTRLMLSLALVAMLATPAAAQEDLTPEHAEQRLRGCLLTGASAAPRSDLRSAIIAVRAFCAPQIKRVRHDRVAEATRGIKGDAAKPAEDRAIRRLNSEIALAISNFTGLTL